MHPPNKLYRPQLCVAATAEWPLGVQKEGSNLGRAYKHNLSIDG